MALDYICKLVSFKIPTKYELWSNLKLVLMTIRRKILPTQEARTIPSAAPYLMNVQ